MNIYVLKSQEECRGGTGICTGHFSFCELSVDVMIRVASGITVQVFEKQFKSTIKTFENILAKECCISQSSPENQNKKDVHTERFILRNQLI